MCILVDKQSKVKAASSDIECYKVVLADTYSQKTTTPFTEIEIEDDVIMHGKPFVAKGMAKRQVVNYHKDKYDVGFVHTYETYENACWVADMFSYINAVMNATKHVSIYKCIIPRGTKFISGMDENGLRCFASKRIVFLEYTPRQKKQNDNT